MMDWKSLLGNVAPTVATVLTGLGPAGALAGGVLAAVSNAVLGHPNGTANDVATAIQSGLPPDAVTNLAKVDADLKVQLATITEQQRAAELQADTQQQSNVSQTMQSEDKSEHWPTYTWRPFIGFVFGICALVMAVTVSACYLGVMFFHADATPLATLPAMLGAMIGVMGTVAPILGIASYFRGKMQADASVPSDNRG